MTATAKFFEHELGSSWIQREPMQRASHALVDGAQVWLVDPVDSDGDVERAIGGRELAGVIQLLDRHNRDCVALAEQHEVPLFRLPKELPDAPFTPFGVLDRPKWREVGLWWPERSGLVVSESLMTVPELAVAGTGVGIHPLLRLTPPRAFRRFPVAGHLLPGHGEPLHRDDVGTRIEQALDKSRRDLPRLILKTPTILKELR